MHSKRRVCKEGEKRGRSERQRERWRDEERRKVGQWKKMKKKKNGGTQEFVRGAEKRRYKEMKWWKKCRMLVESLISN